MPTSVIVAGARTPFGRLLGGLSGLSGAELGAIAIRGALERAGISPEAVDQVVMGQVITAGAGQIPARQASLAAGIPPRVPAITVNKVCLSGTAAIAQADLLIRSGEAEVVVAGGQESMSQAPHLLPGSRKGTKYGPATLVDSMAYDGLHDNATDQPMGELTDQCNAEHPTVTREKQDAFAARSHQRAAAAQTEGRFGSEIVPVTIPQRRGDDVVISADEGVREGTTAESLAGLRPAFGKEGTITAGSASQISDGACALVIMSKERAEAEGLDILAEIGAYGTVAGPDSSLQTQPSRAIRAAAEKEGLDPAGFDLYEINEAFAAVGLASVADLGLSEEDVENKLNVDGGAIALGHPLGASGARVALHLALELKRRGGGTGVVGICGGGGQGDALVLRVPNP